MCSLAWVWLTSSTHLTFFVLQKLSSQDGVCEELRSSLAEARERLEDGERQLKKAVNDRNVSDLVST